MKTKWTKEKCKEVALKCETRTEFKNRFVGAYNNSAKYKWLDNICSHMVSGRKDRYWSKKKCKIVALKCKNRSELQKKYSGAFKFAKRNNILDEICSHMIFNERPIYWTKEKCKEVALNFNSRMDFSINFGAYYSSRKNGWLDEICSHMKPINNKPRCIYVYIFSDYSAYIGLTGNFEKRKREHKNDKNSSVYKYLKNTNNKIVDIIQLTEYLEIDIARIEESNFEEIYKKQKYKILNKIKTGGIGGSNIKWTKEKCKEEALKYNSRSEFKKSNESAYSASNRRYKNLDEICQHMKK